ncbi:MAG TPA: FG-GAP-like repeat-containing protein, partial [Thermomicrobiales bacterium]|nr:FG-GAP-like repeat-containing protein [Thermomicrobiales bacterium]
LDTGYSYKLATDDANVAAGKYLDVDARALGAGNSLNFDGSAETDGMFDFAGGAGNDVLIGGAQGDILRLTDGGADTVVGNAGNDDIQGFATVTAADQIDGGDGYDRLDIDGDYSPGLFLDGSWLKNVEEVDTGFVGGEDGFYVLNEADSAVAAGATLTVSGYFLSATGFLQFNGAAETDGHFVLTGGAGHDTLIGGAQSDRLDGRKGADSLTGGAGDDTFVYAPGDGADHITDFTAGAGTDDKIDLTGFSNIRSFDAVLAHAVPVGEATVLNFGNGDTLALGVAKTDLSPDDFVLPKNPRYDFNADGLSDILWQNDDGRAAIWQMNGATVTGNQPLAFNPGASWHEIGSGDFNADGFADILWQNTDGRAAIWQMNGATVLHNNVLAFNPGASWHEIATGDFNGDG